MPLKRFFLVFALVSFATYAAAANRFVEAGAPSPDKEWSGEDYQTFAALLRGGKIPLPTLADVDGRAMLERMWSTDNLKFARRADLPARARLNDAIAIVKNFNPILIAFGTELGRGKNVSREAVESMNFALRVSAAVCEGTDEYVATIDLAQQPQLEAWPKRSVPACAT